MNRCETPPGLAPADGADLSTAGLAPADSADLSTAGLAPADGADLSTAGTAPAEGAEASWVVQFLRYLIVGGIAFLVDFGTLALLTDRFGWHYLQSAAIGFGIGLAVNYILSIRWVFKVRALKSHRLEFLFFALIGLAGLGINHLFLWTLTDGLHVHYLQSKLVTTAVVLVWNFAARKLLLFTAPNPAAPKQEMA